MDALKWFQTFLERAAGVEPLEVFDVRGIPAVVANPQRLVLTADAIERLDDAVALIERYQPWRLAHLRRDLKQFRVIRYPCRGAYFPEIRACMVELTFLGRRDIGPATVASTIIHEGMHARVHRWGSRVAARGDGDLAAASHELQAASRAREERLCRRAELEFGLALQPEIGAPVVERALASLALEDEDVAPEIDWTEAERRIREIDAR